MLEDRARALVRSVESELKALETAVNLAHWEASTTGAPAAQERATDAEARLRKFLSSASRYREIVELLSHPELHEPTLRRQLELLALDHRGNLLAEPVIDDLVQRGHEIQAEFYTFRARLDGREVSNNEILGILRGALDERRRRAAWEASKQIAPRVAERLRELIRRRNAAARSLGYRDYYAMRMALQEIDEADLARLFDEIAQRTAAPFRTAKAVVDARLAARYGVRPDDLRPWHYEDPFFQEAPLSRELGLGACFRSRDLVAIASRFFTGIGLPIDDVLERSDLYERAGKDQHAYCTNIDREGDVRVLCNLKDDERWMGILLHELGHAAFEKYLPSALPWLLRQPSHIATTEAIAMFMDRLIYDVDWIERAAGATPQGRARFGRDAADALRFELLLLSRWVLVMTGFERALYADPERADLDALWWDLVEELQLLRRPEGRTAPDWAAKIHLTASPVYYHNYLLGEVIASQLDATLRRDALRNLPGHGYADRRELGAFLCERIFTPGASLHWQVQLAAATGSRLTPEAFLVQVAA